MHPLASIPQIAGGPLTVRAAHGGIAMPGDVVAPGTVPGQRQHIATVVLEDYFHGATFRHLIPQGQWRRFEQRVERSTLRTLELLDEVGVRATFFSLGWVADQLPELIRAVSARGHEVASKGYLHRPLAELTREEFRDDLLRSREALENASGKRVVGYRVAQRWIGPAETWALDVLAEEDFSYDSSVRPLFRRFAAEPWRRFAHQHRHAGRVLWEFPISSANLLGWDVPIAGANYFRQFPDALVRRLVAQWDRTCAAPFVLYFHTWELDTEQPKIGAASWLARTRQYRNLERMPDMLRHYFGSYRFASVASYLGLPEGTVAPAVVGPGPAVVLHHRTRPVTRTPAVPVTIVVPCYNEEDSLPFLANTLPEVTEAIAPVYEPRFVFVDDGSTDGTWRELTRLFGGRADCTLLRHERNRGITGAVLTGIRHADSEVVCSIDCDCTYDPRELAHMLPLLTPTVDVVTASPYHPLGHVLNVPGWRLMLSKQASRMYRLVLRHKLQTYTSCFRVYRRQAVLDVPVEHDGFIGIAELLGRMDLSGARIVEHPTTLSVRLLGVSKMKTTRTIVAHLRMLGSLTRLRLARGTPGASGDAATLVR